MDIGVPDRAVAGRLHTLLAPILCALFLLALTLSIARPSRADPLAILGVSPTSAPNSFDTTIVVRGAGFQVVVSGTTVLTAPAVRLGTQPLSLAGLPTGQTLTATVPWGTEPGVYPLTVENADGSTAFLTDAFTVTAGLGVWATGGPYGGSVSELAMDGDVTTTLYANLDAVGLCKTDDGGDDWRNVFPGYVTCFSLKPGHPQTVYLSGDQGSAHRFLRSDDGGESWQVLFDGRPCALGVTPADPERIYVASGSAVSLSLDSGDHWGRAGSGLPVTADITALAVHPVTPSLVYAGDASGQVYRLEGDGGEWTALGSAFGDTWWSVLAVDPHAPQRLYAAGWHGAEFFARSLDGGASWQPMELETGVTFANDICFHPTISGTMYALTFNKIYRSTNGGESWEKYCEQAGGWAFLLDPHTALPAYIGHAGEAVLRSDNGGLVWDVCNSGLAGVRPTDIAVSAADARYVYVAADDAGIFVSNNGGQSWRHVEGDGLKSDAMAADPYTPTVAYMGGSCQLFKTTDGGQSWTPYPLPGLEVVPNVRVNAIAIDPADPQVVYAGAGEWDFTGGPERGWLYRSADAGLTWTSVTVTCPISPVTDIAIDPAHTDVIYLATGRRWVDSTDAGSGVVKTVDGGVTWEYVTEGLTATNVARLAIDPADPQILFAGANQAGFVEEGGIFRSDNAAESWQQSMPWLRISGLEIDPQATQTVYAGSYWAGLFHSTDGGATWGRVDGPLGTLSSLCLDATVAEGRTIIYAGVVGGVVSSGMSASAVAGDVTSAATTHYGGGIYQLVVDHRPPSPAAWLPLILRTP